MTHVLLRAAVPGGQCRFLHPPIDISLSAGVYAAQPFTGARNLQRPRPAAEPDTPPAGMPNRNSDKDYLMTSSTAATRRTRDNLAEVNERQDEPSQERAA